MLRRDTMLMYYTLEWPYDPVRDAVQAYGMAFCQQWKAHGERLSEIVLSDPERFPEFHIPDKKGNLLNTWDYANYHIIMPRLINAYK